MAEVYTSIIGIVFATFSCLSWGHLASQAAITLNQSLWATANTVSMMRFAEHVYSRMRGHWPRPDPAPIEAAPEQLQMPA